MSTAQQDAEDLLHWLNAHSVSISDGIPVSMIQQKWTATKRSQEQLKASLEWLFSQALLTMTPSLTPPHVRLSAKGFQRLLAEMDQDRQPAAPPVQAAPPAAAAAVGAAAIKPAPQAPAAAPAAASEPAAPRRFVEPTQQPTEIGLRNQILSIFRDLNLQTGQQLIAMTLTRYWQEMGQRGEHLRAGIDILLRDGYVQHTVKRYENYWLLTEAGYRYLSAPVSSPALLALAAPLTQIGDGYSDEELCRKGLALFKKNPSLHFNALEPSWRHSRDALIHALDLLCKSGELVMEGEAFRCTALVRR